MKKKECFDRVCPTETHTIMCTDSKLKVRIDSKGLESMPRSGQKNRKVQSTSIRSYVEYLCMPGESNMADFLSRAQSQVKNSEKELLEHDSRVCENMLTRQSD